MAKFKAGDMITGMLEMSDGTKVRKTFFVNLVDALGVQYSLDDGNGWIDGRLQVAEVDKTFKLC